LSRGQGYGLELAATEAVFSFPQPASAGPGAVAAGNVLDVQLLGADPAAPAAGRDELPGKVNYYLGNDPGRWHTGVATFGRVEYQNVYAGINLVYYGNQRQLEYDFVVKPGADPNAIRLNLPGADRLGVDAGGDLVIQTGGRTVREHRPFAYQEVNGVRQEVASAFVVHDHQVSIRVAAYDAGRPLVIDPQVWFGWAGGPGNDYANEIAVDAAGNAYITGAIQFGANFKAYVFKLDGGTGALLYQNIIGGGATTGDDTGWSIAVDGAGDAYVTGVTSSPDFPVVGAGAAANLGPENAFVVELGPAGALLFSTCSAGLGFDRGYSVRVSAAGNAYVTGLRDDRPYFPGGNLDTLVTEFNVGSPVPVYTLAITFQSGSVGYGIGVDGAGNADVVGSAYGFNNAYVLQLNAPGSLINWSRVYPNPSGAYGVAVGADNSLYVTGAYTPGVVGNIDELLTKFTSSGGLVYDWGWTYGPGTGLQGSRIAVDGGGNAYVAGVTDAFGFRLPVVLVTKYGPGGETVLDDVAVDLGGAFGDIGEGIALGGGALPDVFVSGYTYNTLFGGLTDGFATKFTQPF
jgi:hypothetical protein